ncbi:hypothetical protein AGDE_13233 [Angomonas deanei]|uniref:Uncharacterized protein n=1 Tax=Angomonas deanei TaxID=59799 RepID=A0A7G2CNQ0_9TRYP|nr:hypothetical protein AGDE_13233 [Angomonas deanei]CAD2221420.1 hypothetical protein, conserved [Angomonas deanei]|eukprot:EPY22589.1 hypothetical protein AGDE_13233 [Angomonas deanei]
MTDYTRASRSVKQVLQAVRAPFAVEHGQQGPGKTVGKVAPEEKLIAILQKLWSETAAQTENGKSDERSVAAYLKRCRWIHGKYQSGGRTADGLLWSSLSESEKVADEMLYTQKERQKFSRKRDRPQEEE